MCPLGIASGQSKHLPNFRQLPSNDSIPGAHKPTAVRDLCLPANDLNGHEDPLSIWQSRVYVPETLPALVYIERCNCVKLCYSKLDTK